MASPSSSASPSAPDAETRVQRELRLQLFAMLGALFTMTGVILAFG